LRENTAENQSLKGAYVLHEADGARALTLLASGTEVALAVEARKLLAAAGIPAAVVSMPCWELFSQQDAAYQQQVLGEVPRIGVEAAMAFGWERWLRPSDRFVGMDGFGASDKAEVLYAHFGITSARIAEIGQGLVQPGWQAGR
jgi:transketolase